MIIPQSSCRACNGRFPAFEGKPRERVRCGSCGASYPTALPPEIYRLTNVMWSDEAYIIVTGWRGRNRRRTPKLQRYVSNLRKAGFEGPIYHFDWRESGNAPKKDIRGASEWPRRIEAARKWADGRRWCGWVVRLIDFGTKALDKVFLGFRAARRGAADAARRIGEWIVNTLLSMYKRVHILGHSLGAKLALDVVIQSTPQARRRIASLCLQGAATTELHLREALRLSPRGCHFSHLFDPEDGALASFPQADDNHAPAVGTFEPSFSSRKLFPLQVKAAGPDRHDYEHISADLWFPRARRG
jgi:hypothetical protein